MIPQPWRCTEREKTPAPSAVCTHPTPGSTTTTTEPGCLQHPQQLHTDCRNLSLRERTQFRCLVWGEMPSCQAQRKSEPSSQRWGNAHRHLQQTNPTSAVLWSGRNWKALAQGHITADGLVRCFAHVNMQVKFGRTKWENSVWVAGNKFCSLSARERYETPRNNMTTRSQKGRKCHTGEVPICY